MRIFAIEPSSGTSTASDCLDSTTELVGQNSGLVVTLMSNTRLRFYRELLDKKLHSKSEFQTFVTGIIFPNKLYGTLYFT